MGKGCMFDNVHMHYLYDLVLGGKKYWPEFSQSSSPKVGDYYSNPDGE